MIRPFGKLVRFWATLGSRGCGRDVALSVGFLNSNHEFGGWVREGSDALNYLSGTGAAKKHRELFYLPHEVERNPEVLSPQTLTAPAPVPSSPQSAKALCSETLEGTGSSGVCGLASPHDEACSTTGYHPATRRLAQRNPLGATAGINLKQGILCLPGKGHQFNSNW